MQDQRRQFALSWDGTEDDASEPTTGRARAYTVSIKRLSKRELAREAITAESIRRTYELPERPMSYADCEEHDRGTKHTPCAFVSCAYHLALDVSEDTGAIKLNFPGALDEDGALDVSLMPETCALRVASRDGMTLEEVGALTNLTRERVRQIEAKSLSRLGAIAELARLQDFIGE